MLLHVRTPALGPPLALPTLAARTGQLDAAFSDLYGARDSNKEKKCRPRKKDVMSAALSSGWPCASFTFLLVALGAIEATGQTLTFARDDYSSTAGARGVATADFDRNGWLDIAQANLGRNTVTILLNHAGRPFGIAAELPVAAGPFG